MITYNTIKAAFKDGNGDVFFMKNNRYVCNSRHDARYDEMINAGFILLTHKVVKALAEQQTEFLPESTTPLDNLRQMKTDAEVAKLKFTNRDTCDYGYYDEYPDAYGQHL